MKYIDAEPKHDSNLSKELINMKNLMEQEPYSLELRNNSLRKPKVQSMPGCDVIGTSAVFEPQKWCGQHLTGQEESSTKSVYNYSQLDECRPKTPMCRIAELARYNKIKHEYKLMDESGPAHKKQFTVSLVLTPDQVYYGKGASIKKAQQAAAESALNGTSLLKPPNNNLPKKITKDLQNPIVLLSYVAKRLGIAINFIDEVVPICPLLPPNPIVHSSTAVRSFSRSSFVPVVNKGFFIPPPPAVSFTSPHIPAAPQQVPVILHPPNRMIPPRVPYIQHCDMPPQPFYQIRLVLGKNFPEFTGRGMTKKRARSSAANQALTYLGPHMAALEVQSKEKITNGMKNELPPVENEGIRESNFKSVVTTTRNGKPKSSISQIHECALQMRMNVEFLILKEEGPAHDRHYVLRCKLISAQQVISADGEGSSKKIAKQNACSLLLANLRSIESSPVFIAASMMKSQKKISAQRELKRKTISKDMKMSPEYGHQINPISRLMQVTQARKQSEPKFQLIAERGQSRYKEFVMEVTCDGGFRCEGTGPNKKLAKRAAAEAMLATMGYVKPMPPPGKSLLKKRSMDQTQPVEIGVFKVDDEGKGTGVKKEDEDVSCNEKVSEVTLSVTASIGSQVMTFADVDKTVHADEQKGVWGVTAAETKRLNGKEQEGYGNENVDVIQSAVQPKRRVTFSNEVSACPPPDDSSYPSAFITPLKSEVVVVNKLRRKGRDSKKWLTETERKEVAEMALMFFVKCSNTNHTFDERRTDENDGPVLANQLEQLSLGGNSNKLSSPRECMTAKRHLESIAEFYKFSVCYTDFPTTCTSTEQSQHHQKFAYHVMQHWSQEH